MAKLGDMPAFPDGVTGGLTKREYFAGNAPPMPEHFWMDRKARLEKDYPQVPNDLKFCESCKAGGDCEENALC